MIKKLRNFKLEPEFQLIFDEKRIININPKEAKELYLNLKSYFSSNDELNICPICNSTRIVYNSTKTTGKKYCLDCLFETPRKEIFDPFKR